jgi:hypothetical protein
MENLEISATDRTPYVLMDFAAGYFCFSGESFPENIVDDPESFYYPVTHKLIDWFETKPSIPVHFEFNFTYMNSYTIKFVIDLMEELDELRHYNQQISVVWYYPQGNKILKELGHEIASEIQLIRMQVLEGH